MQAVIEFIAGLVAILAALALAHLGVDLERPEGDARAPEVHRVSDCPDPAAAQDPQAPLREC